MERNLQQQARGLMRRYRIEAKNRQLSMLERSIKHLGVSPGLRPLFWNHIQGAMHPTFLRNYERTQASFS